MKKFDYEVVNIDYLQKHGKGDVWMQHEGPLHT